MKNRILIVLAMLLFLPTTLFAGEYTIDPDHTTIGFQVKHMTIAHVSGWFEKFKGGFVIDEKKQLQNMNVEMSVNSINTKIEKRDNHLRSADFFEVARYPTMTFKTISITPKDGTYRVKGELTIKNHTKIIELDGQLHGPLKDPWGNERAAIVLNGEVNRKDFGLNWNKVIETGGLLVGDMVQIHMEGEGIRK